MDGPLTDCGLIQSDVQTYYNGSSNVFSRFKWYQTSWKRSKEKGKMIERLLFKVQIFLES